MPQPLAVEKVVEPAQTQDQMHRSRILQRIRIESLAEKERAGGPEIDSRCETEVTRRGQPHRRVFVSQILDEVAPQSFMADSIHATENRQRSSAVRFFPGRHISRE